MTPEPTILDAARALAELTMKKVFGGAAFERRAYENITDVMAIAITQAVCVERSEWNRTLGIQRPDGTPPLSPRDYRLMRAINPDQEHGK